MQLSLTFFLFLAVLLPLYFLLPRRAQWIILLIGSLAFYACAGWQNLCVLLALTTITYTVGRLLGCSLDKQNATLEMHRADGSWDKERRKRYRDTCVTRRKWLLAAGVVADLVLLSCFKYSAFFVQTWNDATGATVRIPSLLLPLGLSYVTFSAIGYLIDVSRGQQICEKNPLRFALFMFYFPQMWQGPINRYGELAPKLFAPHAFDGGRAVQGGLRALWGAIKKLVVADTVATAVGTIMQAPSDFGGTGVILLIVLYSIQIYGDFTGGMDMALGISSVLGIDLYENFDRPFGSSSLAEYWRRWHRSMGRFFTDYVFYPLSVSHISQGLSRLSRRLLGQRVGARIPVWISVLATWFLTGFWHGAGWNFIVWGLCNGVFLLISQELRPVRRRLSERFPRAASSRWLHTLMCIGTFCTVGLFRTLDVYRDVGLTFSLWGRLFTPTAWVGLLDGALWASLEVNVPQWVLVGLGVLLMWAVSRATPRVDDAHGVSLWARLAKRPVLCAVLCALAVVMIAVFGNYGLGYDAMDFIYGQY